MTRPNALALFAILSMIASIARADSSFVQTHCYWDDLRLFEGRIEVLSTPTMTRFGTYQLRLRSRDGSPIPAKVEWQVPIGTEGDGHVRAQVYATATDALADSIAIRADRPGSYQIVAVVTPLNGYGRTESFVRYLRVEADGTTTTPDAFAYDEATMPPLDKEVRMRAATVLANEVEYTGRFTYHDDNTGFQEPVRDATVELVEEVPSGPFTVEQTRESTRTSADGRFAFTPILATNNGQTRRFRVRASLTNQTIELTDSNQTLYRRQTELMNAAAGQTVDLTLQWAFGEASHMVGHVFNVMLDERDFLSRTVNFTRPRIRVLFPTSKGGTFYGYTFRNDQVIAEEINVLFDHRTRRGPLLHEYAHACMTTLADGRASRIPQWTGVADDLPNPHSLHTVSDEGFALSEGWAEWMEAVVDDDALNLRSFSNANEPNVENNKWWTGRSDGRGSNTRGEIVEGAVASILWDIIDTPSSKDLTPGVDDDPVTVGEQNFARIWQIFDETNPLSILKVRTEWVNRNLPNRSEVLGIFNANAIPSERRGTDVNADDDINLLDLVIVAQKFMQSGPFPAPSPDINSDGIVNIVDLVLVAQDFGKGAFIAAPMTLLASGNGAARLTKTGASTWRVDWRGLPELRAMSFQLSATVDGVETPITVRPIQDDGSVWIAYLNGRVVVAALSDKAVDPDALSFEFVADGVDGASNVRMIISQGEAIQHDFSRRSIPAQWLTLQPTAFKGVRLLPNYPNPFNPETWIPFELAEPADVTVRIYNVEGREVRSWSLGQVLSGSRTETNEAIHWDGRNTLGETVASGVYVVVVEAGSARATRKLLLTK